MKRLRNEAKMRRWSQTTVVSVALEEFMDRGDAVPVRRDFAKAVDTVGCSG